MEAKIKLTKTMLDKSIIDANKSVQHLLSEFVTHGFDDPVFERRYDTIRGSVRGRIRITGEYADGERVIVRFYKSDKRGDKRVSIQNLKQYAEAGDTVILTSNEWEDGGEDLIYINIIRQAATDAA